MNRVYNLDAERVERIFAHPLSTNDKWAIIRIDEPVSEKTLGYHHEQSLALFGDQVPCLTVSFYDSEQTPLGVPKKRRYRIPRPLVELIDRFCCRHLNRSFIVICPDGQGRSGALAVYLHELKSDRRADYQVSELEFLTRNPGIVPSRYILNELREAASLPARLHYGISRTGEAEVYPYAGPVKPRTMRESSEPLAIAA